MVRYEEKVTDKEGWTYGVTWGGISEVWANTVKGKSKVGRSVRRKKWERVSSKILSSVPTVSSIASPSRYASSSSSAAVVAAYENEGEYYNEGAMEMELNTHRHESSASMVSSVNDMYEQQLRSFTHPSNTQSLTI